MPQWVPVQQGVVEVQFMLQQATEKRASNETLNHARAKLEFLSSTQPVSHMLERH